MGLFSQKKKKQQKIFQASIFFGGYIVVYISNLYENLSLFGVYQMESKRHLPFYPVFFGSEVEMGKNSSTF